MKNLDYPQEEPAVRKAVRSYKTLKEIEAALKAHRSPWGVSWLLIRRVKDEDLWRTGPDKNFTDWLSGAGARVGMHKSELWKRYGAGRVYEDFCRRERLAGRLHPDVTQISASPNNIALAFRVGGKENLPLADSLINDVLAGTLTRADLDDAMRTVREMKRSGLEKKKKGGKAAPAGERGNSPDDGARGLNAFTLQTTLALNANAGGFLLPEPAFVPKARFRVMPELPAAYGKHPAEIVIAENLSTGGAELKFHGIYIETGRPGELREKLLALQHQADGSSPFDSRWIAVPPGHESIAGTFQEVLPGFGLLSVGCATHSIRVLCRAKTEETDGKSRCRLAEEVILRLMEPAP